LHEKQHKIEQKFLPLSGINLSPILYNYLNLQNYFKMNIPTKFGFVS